MCAHNDREKRKDTLCNFLSNFLCTTPHLTCMAWGLLGFETDTLFLSVSETGDKWCFVCNKGEMCVDVFSPDLPQLLTAVRSLLTLPRVRTKFPKEAQNWNKRGCCCCVLHLAWVSGSRRKVLLPLTLMVSVLASLYYGPLLVLKCICVYAEVRVMLLLFCGILLLCKNMYM